MADFITIKTKDEWGRLSRMEFCVEDLVVLAHLLRTEILTADLEVLLVKDPDALKKLPMWPPNDSAASTIKADGSAY